jgi:hypothetical protein
MYTQHSVRFQNRMLYIQPLTNLYTSTLKMDAVCSSESSAASPTITQCNNLRTELISIINHCEELHSLYSSPSIIRMIKSSRMRWAGHVALMEEKRNAHRILVGKTEGKRPLGRPRRR